MRMVPSMKGSSWSSWRKMTRPLGSSMRRGWVGLNAWSGGVGGCFHGGGLVSLRVAGAVWAWRVRGSRKAAVAIVLMSFRVGTGLCGFWWWGGFEISRVACAAARTTADSSASLRNDNQEKREKRRLEFISYLRRFVWSVRLARRVRSAWRFLGLRELLRS